MVAAYSLPFPRERGRCFSNVCARIFSAPGKATFRTCLCGSLRSTAVGVAHFVALAEGSGMNHTTEIRRPGSQWGQRCPDLFVSAHVEGGDSFFLAYPRQLGLPDDVPRRLGLAALGILA